MSVHLRAAVLALALLASGLATAPALADKGLPKNAPQADDAVPAYRLPRHQQAPDFRLPKLPQGRLVDPAPPKVVHPRPPAVLPQAGAACGEIFAPVCGRIGNGTVRFSNDCLRRSAGAVPVAAAQCAGG